MTEKKITFAAAAVALQESEWAERARRRLLNVDLPLYRVDDPVTGKRRLATNLDAYLRWLGKVMQGGITPQQAARLTVAAF